MAPRAGLWFLAAALLATLIVLPHVLSYSQKEVLVFLVINVLLVASYRLMTLTGEWSLIHVVLMGVGALLFFLISFTSAPRRARYCQRRESACRCRQACSSAR